MQNFLVSGLKLHSVARGENAVLPSMQHLQRSMCIKVNPVHVQLFSSQIHTGSAHRNKHVATCISSSQEHRSI